MRSSSTETCEGSTPPRFRTAARSRLVIHSAARGETTINPASAHADIAAIQTSDSDASFDARARRPGTIVSTPITATRIQSAGSTGPPYFQRMTSGRGRASFGASGTTTGYDRLDGLNLRDGTLVTTANQFSDESAPFDTESLTMKIRTSTMSFFGAYGVTDRLEIGGVVPLVQLNIDGSRVNVYRGTSIVQATGSASASGLADMALRAKYLLVSSRNAGFAAAGEVRLPTGDEAALLGAGRAALKIMAIGSVENPRVGAHGNFAIVRGGASDEIDGSGAVTVAATPRLTIAGELLVRRLTDVRQMVAVSAAHPTIDGVETLRLVPGTSIPTLTSAVTGIKWNVHATLVLTGEVRWRIGNAGLTAPFTPTIAIDYLF